MKTAQSMRQSINLPGSRAGTPLGGFISGSNTGGINQANGLKLRMNSIVTRYTAIVARDSDNITVLAEQFEQMDSNIQSQI